MKIRLKATGLPRTTGYLMQATDASHSGTTYKSPSNLISEVYYQESTGVIGGERLGTQLTAWLPFRALATPTLLQRDDKMIIDINGVLALTLASVKWQSGNIIRYTFDALQDLHFFTINTWYKFSGATNSVNNGIFKVVGIGTNYIDVTNTLRASSALDENTTDAILTNIFPEFEIMDIKRELFSEFEDHYEAIIYQKID